MVDFYKSSSEQLFLLYIVHSAFRSDQLSSLSKTL